MYLKEADIVIKSASIDDAKLLCKWWNDGKVMEHAGFPNGLGTTIDKIIDQLKSDSKERLIIEYQDMPIGEMSFNKVSVSIAELGIKICNFSEHGKGIGTRCLRLLISYLFRNLNFTKIVLDTNLNNTRAQHVYEKIGFKKVKINYDSWIDQLGRLQSSVDYELFKRDFIC
jgi:RimJ/RimL family protein N-acetyltransferase